MSMGAKKCFNLDLKKTFTHFAVFVLVLKFQMIKFPSTSSKTFTVDGIRDHLEGTYLLRLAR